MTLIERIKSEVKTQGMTIKSVERSAGLSTGAISKWNGSTPSVENLYNVSKILNVSMEYLLTGEKKYDSISEAELAWLELYKQLNYCNSSTKDECIGFVKGYIECYKAQAKNKQEAINDGAKP